jgi:hypothetical protein
MLKWARWPAMATYSVGEKWAEIEAIVLHIDSMHLTSL